MTTSLEIRTIARMANDQHPYVLANWDWSTGELKLSFVAKSHWGNPSTYNPTAKLDESCRWASRQAARQWAIRNPSSIKWQVLDLRQVGAITPPAAAPAPVRPARARARATSPARRRRR